MPAYYWVRFLRNFTSQHLLVPNIVWKKENLLILHPLKNVYKIIAFPPDQDWRIWEISSQKAWKDEADVNFAVQKLCSLCKVFFWTNHNNCQNSNIEILSAFVSWEIRHTGFILNELQVPQERLNIFCVIWSTFM